MIRVVPPAHLRTLARAGGEVALEIEAPDSPSPEAVASGAEPFLSIGAIAGGNGLHPNPTGRTTLRR